MRTSNKSIIYLFLRPAQYFYIRSQDPEKVIDVNKESREPGTKLILWSDKGNMADNQLWYEDERGYLHSKLNAFAMDSTGTNGVLFSVLSLVKGAR